MCQLALPTPTSLKEQVTLNGSRVLGKFRVAKLNCIHLVSHVFTHSNYICMYFQSTKPLAWTYSATPDLWVDKNQKIREIALAGLAQ